MTETEFNNLVDATFEALQQALDAAGDGLDFELTGGVLTVEFDNGSSLVFSRQPAARQLWLAARSGGFHFEYDDGAGDWFDTRDGSPLRPFVAAQVRAQGGVELDWA